MPQTDSDVTFKNDLRQFLMKGDDTEKVDLSITFTDASATFTPKKGAAIVVPYESISSMTYDRRARVRKMFVGSRGDCRR